MRDTMRDLPPLKAGRTSSEDSGKDVDQRSAKLEHAYAGDEYDPDAGLSEEEIAAADKALVRKLDFKLIPWLTLLYLASFLDRTNIGNAHVLTLNRDLNNMTGGQYNLALSIFFVSYALFEPLTNVLLKRMRPAIFLTVTMVAWGIVMTLMGLVKNYQGLAAARFFLGLTEAGLFPGIQFYLSCWYKRSEFGIRSAIFFSAAALAGSFGGLLAAGISKMDGVGGKPGWAWIFILEGLATIVIGAGSYWMVQDFPDEATFLSKDELARVHKRLKADKQASAQHEGFQTKYLRSSLTDVKTYIFAFMYAGAAGSLYAFALFLPTIIKQLGYSSIRANLLSVPPYAAGAIMTITVGWLADRAKTRGPFNIGFSLIAVTGFIMLEASQKAGVKYAGVFLGAIGLYPCIANTIVWTSNNVEGVYRKGVVLGVVIGFGNLNGVVSSNIYQTRDAPAFHLGHGIVLGYLSVLLCGLSIVMHFYLRAENRKRLAGERDVWVQGKSAEEIRDMGDQVPDFLYTL